MLANQELEIQVIASLHLRIKNLIFEKTRKFWDQLLKFAKPVLFQDVHVPALQPWTQITSKGPSPQLALPSLGSNIAAHGRTSKRFFLSTPSHPFYFGNFMEFPQLNHHPAIGVPHFGKPLFWELDIVAGKGS